MNGRDIVVEFTPSEGPGQYPKTTIRVKPNVTPVTEDKNVAEKIAQHQPDLKTIFKEPSYDDLKDALEKWLEPEATEAEAEQPATATNETNADENTDTTVNKVDDVSKAFDSLFNE